MNMYNIFKHKICFFITLICKHAFSILSHRVRSKIYRLLFSGPGSSPFIPVVLVPPPNIGMVKMLQASAKVR